MKTGRGYRGAAFRDFIPRQAARACVVQQLGMLLQLGIPSCITQSRDLGGWSVMTGGRIYLHYSHSTLTPYVCNCSIMRYMPINRIFCVFLLKSRCPVKRWPPALPAGRGWSLVAATRPHSHVNTTPAWLCELNKDVLYCFKSSSAVLA